MSISWIKAKDCRAPAAELGFCLVVSVLASSSVFVVDLVGLIPKARSLHWPMTLAMGGMGVLSGVVLGVLLFAAVKGMAIVARKHSGRLPLLLLSTLPLAPFLFLLFEASFSGAWIRRILPSSTSAFAATFIASVLFLLAASVFLWLLSRRLAGLLDRVGLFGISVSLLGMVVALQWINGHAYVRLYPEIHTAMTILGWAAAAASITLLLIPVNGPRGFGWIIAGSTLLLLFVLSYVSALPMLRQSHRIRFLSMAHSPASRLFWELGIRRRSVPRWTRPSESDETGEGHAAARGLLNRKGFDVVLITVDALRADRLMSYGGTRHVSTNLDRWASNAVKFQRAYCHAPHSSFSISSFLTGHPIRSLTKLKRPLPPTLATMLRAAGYQTTGFCTQGIFHTEEQEVMTYLRNNFGFEQMDSHGYEADVLTDKVLSALNRLSLAPKPFFLWVHYFDVHEPYHEHKTFSFGSRPLDRYDSEIAFVDHHLARLFRAFGELDRPPIVIFTADHGEEFGEHGGHFHGSSLYDEQIRVPLFIAVPGLEPRTVEAPVSLMSIAWTVLDLLGLQEAGSLHADSLVPLMLGLSTRARPVFSEVDTKRMVVSGRFKYIWDTWRDTSELYDLTRDPKERRNLSDSKPGQMEALHSLILTQIRKLGGTDEKLPEALATARLGGQAARGLCSLLLDEKAARAHRIEAAMRLSRVTGECAVAALIQSLADPDPVISAEAAIALGELRRPEGSAFLLSLLRHARQPLLRHRAAVAAARLNLKEAAPYLVAALLGPSPSLRYRAAFYLGHVGGSDTIFALLQARRRSELAHTVAESLGQAGSRSTGPVSDKVLFELVRWLEKEQNPHVVQSILKGLGYLGRFEGAAALLPWMGRKTHPSAREAMVRVGGVGKVVFGMDFSAANKGSITNVQSCRQNEDILAWEFLNHTSCKVARKTSVAFVIPEPPKDRTLLLRINPISRKPGMARPFIRLELNGRQAARQKMRWGWQEIFVSIPSTLLRRGENTLSMELDGTKSAEVDHVLVF